ncbi:HD domain-containing protein [Pedobacter sp. AW31-3R]|uniref:HD domain-containing protein n=1 Tax=Pedobacter sp. AW31-3R TaxID=3445781 RepID=UPI003F9F7B0D
MDKDFGIAIDQTISFVKETLEGAEAGHDWFHIERVYSSARHISEAEGGDLLIISLAALLHDIADSKFNGGDEEIGPMMAGAFMESIGISADVIVHVQQIILNMSYKASLGTVTFSSHEMNIVQDADRLDAIGAIGIARAFTYGGYKNRLMYDPAIPPDPDLSKEAYKNSTAPTINHFYEKLLRLKDLMRTATGKQLAENRHQFMLSYLDQFYGEWKGKR